MYIFNDLIAKKHATQINAVSIPYYVSFERKHDAVCFSLRGYNPFRTFKKWIFFP